MSLELRFSKKILKNFNSLDSVEKTQIQLHVHMWEFIDKKS